MAARQGGGFGGDARVSRARNREEALRRKSLEAAEPFRADQKVAGPGDRRLRLRGESALGLVHRGGGDVSGQDFESGVSYTKTGNLF